MAGQRRLVQTSLDEFFTVGVPPVRAATPEYTEVVWYVGDVCRSDTPTGVCTCQADCNEQCKNRKRRVECGIWSCKLDGVCSNRAWAMSESCPAGLEVRATNRVGYGVYSIENVAKGAVVCEYLGEVIDVSEKRRRAAKGALKYVMAYGPDKFIDAEYYGNVSRFCNHSCEPNCRAEEWTVEGVYRIGIVALRNIRRGEEVTFSYGPWYRIDECNCIKCSRTGVAIGDT